MVGASAPRARIDESPKKAIATRSVIPDGRIRCRYVLVLVLVVLAASNSYFILTYRAAERERTNAFGMLLIAAEGAFSQSTHILSLTAERRHIDFDLWDDLQRDLIWQSRIFPPIAYLDTRHRPYWIDVQNAVSSLERVVSSVKQLYASIFIRLLNLTEKQTTQIVVVRDLLLTIGTNAFPEHVILGGNPEVVISDENMMRAAQLSG